MFDNEEKDIRYDVSERITWALFRQDQQDLGMMIEGHYNNKCYLSLDERQAVCDAWQFLEIETKLNGDDND